MRCEFCDDTGWRPVEHNGVRQVQRCDCRRAKLGQQRLTSAKIDRRYQACTLENFQVYNPSLERALAQARQFVDGFPTNSKGLFFEGLTGVGKTHLAAAILREVIRSS